MARGCSFSPIDAIATIKLPTVQFSDSYNLILAGFTTSNLLSKNRIKEINGSEKVSIEINHLLHGSGLKTFLTRMEENYLPEWSNLVSEIEHWGGDISSLILGREGHTAYTGCSMHHVSFPDFQTQQCWTSPGEFRHPRDTDLLALDDAEKTIAVGCRSRVDIWDIRRKKYLVSLTEDTGDYFKSIHFSRCGQSLFLTTRQGCLFKCSIGTEGKKEIVKVLNFEIEYAAKSINLGYWGFSNDKGEVFLWDDKGGLDYPVSVPELTGSHKGMEFAPSGKQLIIYSKSNISLVSWTDSREKRIVSPYVSKELFSKELSDDDDRDINNLALSPDGQLIAIIFRLGTVGLYTFPEFKPVKKYPATGCSFSSQHGIAFNRDSQYLAAGAGTKIRRWSRL